ncbi:cytochrome c oxidase subunit II [Alicyclobacillus tolerans]|uniref:cytochrome c oxidase subunit II n=1 Tax=Alicyclobacillus tolerans TaxID=90970 RepID=UPI001F309EE5|nr:cytochrome c oxidase subunit II [Alicyclobacillus tolerans]MCF8565337.1 cytochrome c oxidase subunit II [Alicyclobacillus tolerans]
MRDSVVFGVLWVVLSAVLEWLLHPLATHFYIYVASNTAVSGQKAAAFIFSIALPIFVFVVLMLIYGAARFRRKPGETGNSKHQFKTNKVFILFWFGLSLVANLFLFVHPTASAEQYYFSTINQPGPNGQQPLIVDVTARQWEWFFSYPQYGITQAVDSNGNDFLELPVNRPVKFVLRSYEPNHTYDPQADVIHSFWIPAFGMKTDVIPGLTRYEYVTPTKITSTQANQMARVQCAEVCGPGHPWMEADMAVVSSANFAKWIQQEKKLQGS